MSSTPKISALSLFPSYHLPLVSRTTLAINQPLCSNTVPSRRTSGIFFSDVETFDSQKSTEVSIPCYSSVEPKCSRENKSLDNILLLRLTPKTLTPLSRLSPSCLSSPPHHRLSISTSLSSSSPNGTLTIHSLGST